MQITTNVYRLDSSRMSYAYLITGKEPTLIDTCLPWAGKRILREIGELGVAPEKIKHILLTHGDIDHVGNAVFFQERTGATLWASEAEIPLITGSQPRPGIKKYFGSLFSIRKPEKIKPFPASMKIGEIRIIPTPGHTPGHVCFQYQDILFAGDLLEIKKGKPVAFPSRWSWNPVLQTESFRKINPGRFRWICPAHSDLLEVKI